ncbi:MAG TPA: sugar phosphate isomerase/epimerase family protein [Bryobacteraceae bacterium]|nr:sugar phosphate isomerase/epimerase family protein [Bryobacteraceae bacterium]
MQVLKDLEIGVMFWAGRDPLETVREVKALGVRCGQLAIPGDLKLDAATTAAWKRAIADEDFHVVTVFAAYNGEDYADIPTVGRTVGLVPPATRAAREQRTYAVSDLAAALGVPAIALHIGCVPEDPADPTYIEVRDTVRRVADYAAKWNQVFALETGQEPAPVLLKFIQDVDRPNLRINFDPANMILYGTGDPIEALEVLGPLVVSAHAKDGKWPAKDKPGAMGVEQPFGKGDVGPARFVAKLKQIGYAGTLNVEREGVADEHQRLEDVRNAVILLEGLVG